MQKTSVQTQSIAIIGASRLIGLLVWLVAWAICSAAIAQSADAGRPDKLIVVNRDYPAWLQYSDGSPFFMCGPGDPEGFLYRGTRRTDGTRDGDQLTLIEKLAGTGANSIYLMAVRSHGGDGEFTHNPFIDSDPDKGINTAILDQWEQWFSAMEAADIVIYFFIYDDSSSLWHPRLRNLDRGNYSLNETINRFKRRFQGDDSVSAPERAFIHTLVNRFEHHPNLIWCVAEEFEESFSAARVKNIAAEIRAADDYDHVIAVHRLTGVRFDEFADDPLIDQFAMQYDAKNPAVLHAAVVEAWRLAAGRYNLNMAEIPYGATGSGAEARHKIWAMAMGGAYIMINGMDIENTAIADLEDCGRMVDFFRSTGFWRMAPDDELAYEDSEYVLADRGLAYIVYSAQLHNAMGLKQLPAGRWRLKWLDVANGTIVETTHLQAQSSAYAWPKPKALGPEVVIYLRRYDP
jgi:hypothetical protein